MSDGVGPSIDISLPKEDPLVKTTNKPPIRLSLRHFNVLAVMIILSATGLVTIEDFAFVLFSLFYIYPLSNFAFPLTSPHPDPPVFDRTNKTLSYYVSFAAVIGLFLPVAYILEGIFTGDKEGIKAAVPHLFLLASQVFMEGIAFTGNFSLPIRVFVPVFYNSKRIFTIVDWLRYEFLKDLEYGGSVRRLFIGRGLAIANMAFWCFNLFGFLLPVFLPKAFKIYYSSRKID